VGKKLWAPSSAVGKKLRLQAVDKKQTPAAAGRATGTY
jgi:hypothetical protein